MKTDRTSEWVVDICDNKICLSTPSEFLTRADMYSRIVDCVNFIQIDKQ